MKLILLGGLRLENADGAPARPPTRRTALALAVIALEGAAGIARERLSELVWPGRSEAQARGSLRHALAALRKLTIAAGAAGPRLLVEDGRARLDGPSGFLDVAAFEALTLSSAAADLTRAAALYHGPLLEGVDADGALDALLTVRREALHRRALDLVERLSLAAPTPGESATAEALADALLKTDPAAEPAHRALIRLAQARGAENEARRRWEICKQAVGAAYGAPPEAITASLMRVAAQEGAAQPPLSAPGRAQPAPPERPEALAPATSRAESAAGERPSLVVMPFDGVGLAADDVLLDGVVEEITGALSRNRDFFVIARQSAYAYRGQFVDPRRLRDELGVRYAVEGAVRRGGDRLRITVQLVDTESGAQIWSDRYDGDAADLFALQDRIASHVAGALQPSIRSVEIARASRLPRERQQAYDLTLRALPHFWRHTAKDNAAALSLFDAAVRMDPEYGVALGFEAWCLAQNAAYLWTETPAAARRDAISLARRAARCAADHPTALLSAGAALTIASDDLSSASRHIERCLALDPNNAWGWLRKG